MGPSHTVKAFDEELDGLRGTIAEMGGLAEEAIRAAMEALVKRDDEGAKRVIERDARIDALEAEVERSAVQIIALRAPMADDLREVVAALKIAGIVERIGDHATNVAEMVYFAATGSQLGDRARGADPAAIRAGELGDGA